MSDPPRLVQPLEIIPLDTSSTGQKYLVTTAEGRRFEISEPLFEIISLIDGTRSPGCIASDLPRISGKEFSGVDVERAIAEFLLPGGIVAAPDGAPSKKKSSSYLHIKIPLLSQELIRPVTGRLHILFRPECLISGMVASLSFIAYFYIYAARPEWDVAPIGVESLLEVYGIYLIATLIHELGHSSACIHFGARPGHIGIGLYLFFPVFYTDVSDVWKLRRAERAAVDIGGIYFQLLLLPLLYSLYLISGNAAYVYAVYLLTFSSLTALNPLLRFDGYWLISDLAGLPSLRKRSGHLLAELTTRFGKKAGGDRSKDLHIPARMVFFLYTYTAASNLFFFFFIYELVSSIPAIFRNYPDTLSVFLSGLVDAVRYLDFGGLAGPLAALFFPTMVLVMLATMSYQIGRSLVGRLNAAVHRRRLGKM